jgi:hypothetical protein
VRFWKCDVSLHACSWALGGRFAGKCSLPVTALHRIGLANAQLRHNHLLTSTVHAEPALSAHMHAHRDARIAAMHVRHARNGRQSDITPAVKLESTRQTVSDDSGPQPLPHKKTHLPSNPPITRDAHD